MKTETYFLPEDRYYFDFGLCTYKNGFAQIDTSQDAHYYGSWCNPTTLKIVNYCEGDVSIMTAKTIEEFINKLEDMQEWSIANGYGFGIDPGLNPKMERDFHEIGLKHLLH